MKILTLGLGAFGFAVNKLIGENNPNDIFYAFELNKQIVTSLKETRKHPFFFEGYKLPQNIEIVDNYDDIISNIDLLIIAIPAQFISQSIDSFKDKLKPGVTIMNLAKGIDIKTNNPISRVFAEKLVGIDYNYSVLSGGMIAQELVEGRMLGADLGIIPHPNNSPHPNPLPTGEGIASKGKRCSLPLPLGEGIQGGGLFSLTEGEFSCSFTGEQIKKLLENKNFKIKIQKDILNIELYGSLKNIMAIMVGYYEGKGDGKSSIGFHLVNFYDEMREIIKIYGGNGDIDFSYYSLGGDIVATCFGGSRNRYFGQLLGSGKKIGEILEQLKLENKHAEGYETLKAVYETVKYKEGFEIVKFLYSLIK